MYDIYPEINFEVYSVNLQIQGIEDFTKVMIVQTSIDVRKFRWNTKKYEPSSKLSVSAAAICELDFFEQLRPFVVD